MVELQHDGFAAVEDGGQMSDELKELIESTHAMAEMLKLNYDSFMQA